MLTLAPRPNLGMAAITGGSILAVGLKTKVLTSSAHFIAGRAERSSRVIGAINARESGLNTQGGEQ